MQLNFTDQEISILGRALGLMPYNEVSTLIANLQTQINEQTKDEDQS